MHIYTEMVKVDLLQRHKIMELIKQKSPSHVPYRSYAVEYMSDSEVYKFRKRLTDRNLAIVHNQGWGSWIELTESGLEYLQCLERLIQIWGPDK